MVKSCTPRPVTSPMGTCLKVEPRYTTELMPGTYLTLLMLEGHFVWYSYSRYSGFNAFWERYVKPLPPKFLLSWRLFENSSHVRLKSEMANTFGPAGQYKWDALWRIRRLLKLIFIQPNLLPDRHPQTSTSKRQLPPPITYRVAPPPPQRAQRVADMSGPQAVPPLRFFPALEVITSNNE